MAATLLNLIKTISINFNPQLIQQASLSATTMTNIVTKCIAGEIREEIYNHLAHSPFSLILDESSDLLGGTYLTLHVKYLNKKEQKITTKLVSIYNCKVKQQGLLYLRRSGRIFPVLWV